MYRTISVSNSTFQLLNSISSYLDKPKSQVIDYLAGRYMSNLKKKSAHELEDFNASVTKLGKQIHLPKGSTVKTKNMDEDMHLLSKEDL